MSLIFVESVPRPNAAATTGPVGVRASRNVSVRVHAPSSVNVLALRNITNIDKQSPQENYTFQQAGKARVRSKNQNIDVFKVIFKVEACIVIIE
ncbi:hypothetical protein SESBI_19719 [Sesbania bispinosa]|nr:hypothetical protein SESBI_19719 [Sesbania bispinosa]